jgi:hypothetical protein
MQSPASNKLVLLVLLMTAESKRSDSQATIRSGQSGDTFFIIEKFFGLRFD